jgi:hypothetical protein
MKSRYQTLQTLADAVAADCKGIVDESAGLEIQISEEDPESQTAQDPRDYLPVSIRNHRESEVLLEQVGRMLWFDPKHQANLKSIEMFYDLCCSAFPESVFIRFLNAYALLNLGIGSLYANQEKLYEISCDKETTFVMRYSLFRENMEIVQNSASSKSKGKDKLDLVSYVELQKFLLQAEKHYENSIMAIRGFWYVPIVA